MLVDVAPCAIKKLDHRPVRASLRDPQRRDKPLGHRVRIRAAFEQRLRGLEPTGARRVHQRRQLLFEVERVDLRTPIDQEMHGRRFAAEGRAHQRARRAGQDLGPELLPHPSHRGQLATLARESERAFRRAMRQPLLEQELEDFGALVLDRDLERAVATGVEADVGPGVEQAAHERHRVVARCEVQDQSVVPRSRRHIRSGVEQVCDDRLEAPSTRERQRGVGALRDRVDLGAIRELSHHRGLVVIEDGLHQGRPAAATRGEVGLAERAFRHAREHDRRCRRVHSLTLGLLRGVFAVFAVFCSVTARWPKPAFAAPDIVLRIRVFAFTFAFSTIG